MPVTDFAATLSATRVIPVVVLDDAAQAQPLGDALAAAGLHCAEVTLRTAAAAKSIEILSARPDFLVGAGTVVTVDQVDQAMAVGAQFVVSPGLDPAVVTRCQELSMPVLPGVATATELQAAMRLDIDIVKFFPAESLGGANAIRVLSGPFGDMRFVPSGGIGRHNLADYLSLPSVIAVGGSWLVAPDLVAAADWDAVTSLAREALDLAGEAARN